MAKSTWRACSVSFLLTSLWLAWQSYCGREASEKRNNILSIYSSVFFFRISDCRKWKACRKIRWAEYKAWIMLHIHNKKSLDQYWTCVSQWGWGSLNKKKEANFGFHAFIFAAGDKSCKPRQLYLNRALIRVMGIRFADVGTNCWKSTCGKSLNRVWTCHLAISFFL